MEGSAGMSGMIARNSELLDIVFSWSLADIFDENLYKEKVKKIPESFETVKEYFNSYVFPLLEETRADLCSSIETMSGAPFSELLPYVEVKPGCRSFNDQSHLYDIKVGEWRNNKVRGKEPYNTLPGDIFALVNCRPESIQDLSVVAQTWVLAHVERISQVKTEEDDRADETLSNFFRVRLSVGIDLVDDGYSAIFLVYLLNITTNKRMWNALHMHGNLKIIKRVLQRNTMDEDDHGPCCSSYDDDLFGSLCLETCSRLNPSQNETIVASLQAIQCEHRPHVQLVWGPPGTGKTKTLSILIYLLLKKNCRILTCAPTNTAITQVARYVLELMKNASPEDSGWFLGNILLFGSKQRLRAVGSDVEDIYLDYRINRLAECFKPMTGWRSCFPMLSYFLDDCVSEYNIFLENESRKREQSIDKVDSASQMKSFVTFLRDRFKAAAEPVRKCVAIFCTHLSKSFIGEHNIENMKSLLNLLDSFETLLLQDDVNSSELLEQFSNSEHENIVNGSVLLEEKRRKCISAIKTLQKSLGEIELPAISLADSMTEEYARKPMLELCFQMASLVFCTASSSDMLHRLREPFDVLVVDEAAQLKECESAIPLQLCGLRHAILFGDDCQLPAMVNSNISSNAGFGQSLFQRLSLLGWPKHLLNEQYRMHPSISAFPNTKFYFKQILDAPNVRNKCYEKCYLPGRMYGPYSFINVSEGREELDDDGRSKRNIVEAAVVGKILQGLYKSWRSSSQRLSIGVISPYGAQVVAIEEMLGRRYEELENFAVKVKSVDGFQGGEEDIVIISTVRSNLRGSVGFIGDLQRTNVALTRARHCLWIIGHEATLIQSDSIWNTLISDAKERNCFYNADEDTSLAQAVIDIKKELDQLDDLLNRDSILFKSARWKVLFSDNFVKTFSKLPTARAKKSVMNLLVKLSNGWRPKKIKADPVCESTLQIVKQYKVEGRFIICTNDIIKEGIYFQVLKIWDIVPLEDIAKLVRRLENIYKAFTDDFLSRCRVRSLQGELEVPRTWNTSLDIVRFKGYNCSESATVSDDDSDCINYAENAKVSESLLLMKFYALSAGIVSHLLSDFNGRALDLPFEVTDEEKRIIQYNRSSFILGRSGTGKTTVLTMKLFQKEQLHHLALEGLGEGDIDASNPSITDVDGNSNNEHVLRQLFVTVSPKLCHAIKHHVSQLKSFAQSESSSMESVATVVDCIDDRDQFRGIPDSFVGIPPKSYPLVVTFNKFLLMLDGTLGPSYFDRFRDEMKLTDGGNSSSRSAALFMRRKEVNFEKFSACYWPHINSELTKRLDASRVFTEIISSIKGGLQAGETDGGKISMENYLQLSEGRSSTLSWQQREMIYSIFLDYEQMRVERGEFDLADLVNDLHWRLKHERYDGDSIDFVYIDEVQDLTIRQIALFKYICRNVEEGFVFSGDTAQTIARGIDFRFQDVRCLFFKEFVMRKRNDDGHKSEEKGQISPIFHLSQNFRTHAGILKLGDSVIQLIYHFFPQTVDILPPETSLIFGEAPILLESGSDENAIVTIFGNTGNVGGNLVGFGAEQVILVRDDSVRKEISSYVGKHALVLTIIECKGLEFQDVLLYNFFGSSPLRNKWRVIYEYMKVNDLLDSTLPQSFPDFNPGKHNVLCSELKQLYVAITRTRQRLWLCENKEDISKPMFDYWKKKHVVQVRQLDDSLARAMQVASSPEEWRARGKKLLAVNNYEVATMCFERAGDKHWETFAKAAGLEASAARAQNPEEAFKILTQAGELFESINEYKRGADCYYESKHYDKAGRIYHQHCGASELERAGECFTLSGCYELAAQVYAKGNFFSECLSSCTKGNLLDMGLQYIQCWKHQATLSQCSLERQRQLDAVEQSFLEKCALSYYDGDDRSGMMKFVKAFCSEDAMRNFLRKLDCLEELLMLEEELGNFSKAADIARERGDFLLEAGLLEKSGLYKEACDLFLWHAFASCLWAAGGNGWPLKQQKVDVLLKAKNSAYGVGPQQLYNTACIEILILLNRNHSLSVLKELLTTCRSQKCVRWEIMLTRRILDLMLDTHVSKYECESRLVDDLCTHSMHMISQNKVSVETMIYFWNSCKETILAIFKYMKVFEHDETSDLEEIGEFFFNYLGVRKQSLNISTIYVCLYPEAKWLGDLSQKSQKSGKLFSIDKQRLLSAARDYWSAELFCTGIKVLRILEALLKHTNKAFMSPFSKSRIATHVYEVAQLLSSWKYLENTHPDSRSLQKCIDLSLHEFFGNVFPVNWRQSVCKDMIMLRETHVSRKMLEEVIIKNLQGKGQLTYGQLGRVTMVMLGSSKGKAELCETVLESLDVNSSWRSFFMVLSGYESSDCPNDGRKQLCTSLAFNLHAVLSELHSANWQRERDYIIPICFLHLVDRLMVSLVEFRGSFITCRSSFVEWLIHYEWKPTCSTDLASTNDGAAFESDTFVFLCHIVHQLIVKKRETIELFRNVVINVKKDYLVLLLRLVILMCLLHLNYGMCWHLLRDVLHREYITAELPSAFCKELWRKNKWVVNLATVARALKAIGDPLVIVTSREGRSDLSCEDAIQLLMVNQDREGLLRSLFPDDVKFCQGGAVLHKHSQSTFTSQDGQLQKPNGGYIELKSGVVWELFDSLKLVENEDDQSRRRLVSCAPRIKAQVDGAYDNMTRVIAQISAENCTMDDESKNYAAKAECLLLELRLLSAALDASGEQLRDRILLIKDIFERLESLKPVFEHFLGPLVPQKHTTPLVKEVKVIEDRNLEEAQKDDPSVPDPGNQSSNRGSETNLEDHDDAKNDEESNLDESQRANSSATSAVASASASTNQNDSQGSKKNNQKGNKKSKNKKGGKKRR